MGGIKTVLMKMKWGSKNDNQEEEKNKIVEFEYNWHCPKCAFDVQKCCKKVNGVVSATYDKEKPEIMTVKGKFKTQRLKDRIWEKKNKKVEIVKEEIVEEGSSSGTVEEENTTPSPPSSAN